MLSSRFTSLSPTVHAVHSGSWVTARAPATILANTLQFLFHSISYNFYLTLRFIFLQQESIHSVLDFYLHSGENPLKSSFCSLSPF